MISGDLHLYNGCEMLFINKANASQDLQKAFDEYTKVRGEARSSMLRERALFGLARTYEALSGTRRSQGELEKAIQNYQELVSNRTGRTVLLPGQGSAGRPQHPTARPSTTSSPTSIPSPSSRRPLTAPSFDSKSLQEQPPAPSSPGLDIKFPEIGKNLGKSTDQDKGTKASPPVKPAPARPARDEGSQAAGRHRPQGAGEEVETLAEEPRVGITRNRRERFPRLRFGLVLR